MIGIKIADIFNSFYVDYFERVRRKVILNFYSYDHNDELYYVRLMSGVGIHDTELFMVQVLKKERNGYSKQEKLNCEFHTEDKANDYISGLIHGGVEHAESGPH
jgi:hypothetical protein